MPHVTSSTLRQLLLCLQRWLFRAAKAPTPIYHWKVLVERDQPATLAPLSSLSEITCFPLNTIATIRLPKLAFFQKTRRYVGTQGSVNPTPDLPLYTFLLFHRLTFHISRHFYHSKKHFCTHLYPLLCVSSGVANSAPTSLHY